MYVRKAQRRHEACEPRRCPARGYSPLRSSGTLPNFRSNWASPNSPIMGSPVRLKATAPMLPAARRQGFRAPQRARRTLAFLRSTRDRRAGVVLQERQRDVIGDIGHALAPGGLVPSRRSIRRRRLSRSNLRAARSRQRNRRLQFLQFAFQIFVRHDQRLDRAAQVAVAHRDRLVAGLFVTVACRTAKRLRTWRNPGDG